MSVAYIFLCNNKTEKECFEKSLFGGRNYYSRIKGMILGAPLFLYNYDSLLLHGIFESQSNIQLDIDPEAWEGKFPCQVKVKRIKEYSPISRETIGDVLRWGKKDGFPSSKLDKTILTKLVKLFDGG